MKGKNGIYRPGESSVGTNHLTTLKLFAENPNRPLQRDWLLESAAHREMEAFDRAIDLDPGHVDALFKRSAVHRLLGAFDRAAADFDRAVQMLWPRRKAQPAVKAIGAGLLSPEAEPQKADPNVRAGFMLIPDRGASTVMNAATSAPANSGVKRLRRCEFEVQRMVPISNIEMANSARKATHKPAGPGVVTT